MPQNSPNLEYLSHLPKNVIIYCRPQFPPLGGAIINKSGFWLMTQTLSDIQKPSRSLNCAESRGIGHAHFRLTFFQKNA